MYRLSCLIVALAMSKMLLAQLVPVPGSQPVKLLFEAADVVCSGRVESLHVLEGKGVETGNGALLLKRVVASVYVQDTYRANETLPSSILVSFDEEAAGVSIAMPTLQQDEFAILFLKHSEDSSYVFADPYMGVTRFASIPGQEGGSGLLKLESTLAEIVRENGRPDKIAAMQLLHGMEKLQPATLREITPQSVSRDPELAFGALAIMIKAGAPGSIETLEEQLQGYQGNGALWALADLDGDLNQSSNREDLPALESLTSSKFMTVRLGSMEAIHNIGNLTSAPTLIRRLCDRLCDSDSTIRYLAVISLAEIFHKTGDYKPSMAEFSMSPLFYANQWRVWCAHDAAAFEEPASTQRRTP